MRDDDLKISRQPIDFLGVNYYSTTTVRHRDKAVDDPHAPMPGLKHVEALPPEGELTAMGWNQDPQGLTDLLMYLKQRFPTLDVMVTENGSAWGDQPADGNVIHDPRRVRYLREHVSALAQALVEGANVRGYYAWSLIDNFEWNSGYTKRFGLIGIDYDTQERTWKDSASLYERIVHANAIPEGD
ncbi:hypothetical protein BW12_10845 [Bifidobacterium sp. UTCIF-3]|uniref:family 1 glycosylhydrolase n=1 Tax=unclassified Bifidobacterium TaxID=2608897 RepID=UPI001DB73E7E|nr:MULTISPECIES: family 1 glycosylhydrolase [unclassified Bifidobacterium]TPF77232.1 hypothetical protein BW09_10785 [Bifidobacterium sp. UTCIF-1]TPF79763.1 hypothetical protein BW08_08350 [Bifidobacterium sp. UTCIF-24]TPF81286.1 hypothetical protein BW12_10845 [Bifidobacterium sp. UTCIF-3]TPF83320.1 hypothetical protein BW07_10935 [Bifidobacterium sp. UTCIF-36]